MKSVVIAISVAVLIAVCVAGLTLVVIVQQLKIHGQHEQIFALKKANLELASRALQAEPPTGKRLLEAVNAGDVAAVRSILAQNPEMLRARIGADGATPLHAAVYTGQRAVVEQLLGLNADVNARNDLGSTPLHDAMVGGRAEIVTLLLEKNPDLKVRNNAGETALRVALAKDRPDLAELLLVRGAKE
jgi:ankyrin repeat protein